MGEEAIAGLLEALRGVLTQVAEPDAVIRTILEQAVSRTGASRGVFVEVAQDRSLDFKVLHRYRPDLLEDSGHYSHSIFQLALETGDDVLLEDATADGRLERSSSIARFRMVSVLCMLIRSSDRVTALVHIEHEGLGYFRAEHRKMLRPLLDLAAPLLDALRAGRDVMRERDRLAISENRYREEAEESRGLLARTWSFGRFVGRSAAIRELEETIRKAASSPYSVLLSGETGTGKSILARVLHSSGPRSDQPFVTVFCPSLEKSMMEAELFGHSRGAFTGADRDRIGKVQAAEGGTLFLDEIGELPLEVQPKLLRLLQERTYERLGDPKERRADVRVIAATNRDLDQEVREKRFRRDLFERLNFIPVRVPPLRDRREDVPRLLRHTLDQTEAGRWIEFTEEAAEYLRDLDFTWPGNVRHIEQLAARLTIEETRRAVTALDIRRLLDASEDAGIEAPSRPGDGMVATVRIEAGLPALLEQSERAWLQEALRQYPGLTRSELAAKLMISESALYKKLKTYALG